VWPPPSENSRLVDPFMRDSNVDLGGIVNSVMGPSAMASTSTVTTVPGIIGAAGVEGGVASVTAANASAAKRMSTGTLTIRNAVSPDEPVIKDDAESFYMIEDKDFGVLPKRNQPVPSHSHARDWSVDSRAGLLDDDPFASPSSPPRIITSHSPKSASVRSLSPPSSPTASVSRLGMLAAGLPPTMPKKPSPLAHEAMTSSSSLSSSFVWEEGSSLRGTPRMNWLERSPRKNGGSVDESF
jgi:hypothetical protein